MDRITWDEGNVVSSPRIIYHYFVRLGFRRALLRAGFGMEPVATWDSGLERCAGYNFVMNHQKKRVNHGDSLRILIKTNNEIQHILALFNTSPEKNQKQKKNIKLYRKKISKTKTGTTKKKRNSCLGRMWFMYSIVFIWISSSYWGQA
jgi:hypothetical protein